MYAKGIGGGTAIVGTGGALATTGFPIIGMCLITIALLVLGFVLLRIAVVHAANR
jgi:hypothetical protein